MRYLYLTVFSVFLFSPTFAYAHWGHVGELAGHGHLIGIGALAAAAALAAALAKPKKDKEEESENGAEESSDLEGETA